MAPRPSKSIATSIDDIEAQIAKLNERKKGLLKKRAERITKLVSDSGLAELDIDDETLLSALKELTARFQGKTASQVNTSAAQD